MIKTKDKFIVGGILLLIVFSVFMAHLQHESRGVDNRHTQGEWHTVYTDEQGRLTHIDGSPHLVSIHNTGK